MSHHGVRARVAVLVLLVVGLVSWLLWQLLRLSERTGAAPWGMVYEQARRARADVLEGFAKRGNGGALFVSRLKQSPHWEELRRASGRVGSRPLRS